MLNFLLNQTRTLLQNGFLNFATLFQANADKSLVIAKRSHIILYFSFKWFHCVLLYIK